MERCAAELEIGEQSAGRRQAIDDGWRGEVAHGLLGEIFVLGIPSEMRKEICGAREGDVFIALRMWGVAFVCGRFRSEESDAVGIAEIFGDEIHRGFGVGEPFAIAYGAVEREKGAGHGG